jgi:hypothetical protein
MGQIVKITLNSQETPAIIMVWAVFRLKNSRNSSNYNGLVVFQLKKSRNTSNSNGLGDYST